MTVLLFLCRRIDFRELVRDLFALYKTRIWMQQIDASFQPSEWASRALATGSYSSGSLNLNLYGSNTSNSEPNTSMPHEVTVASHHTHRRSSSEELDESEVLHRLSRIWS